METSLTKVPRIEGVDALRGFAVMAIILVHNLEHFIFFRLPDVVPGLVAGTRPRRVYRHLCSFCRQSVCHLRPAVWIYVLYSKP